VVALERGIAVTSGAGCETRPPGREAPGEDVTLKAIPPCERSEHQQHCNTDTVSTTRMMILGLVGIMQPVHGYDVRRELLSWGADRWANIQPGSIYHALKKLAEEGLLREAGQEQVGGRPARTRYEITPKGHEEFMDLLRGYWWGDHAAVDPFVAAFSFLPALPREEAAAALRHRALMLRAMIEGARDGLKSGWAVPTNKPTHVGWMLELSIARGEGEIAWCERTADLVESGVPYVSPELAARWDAGSDND
jgi:DNA-binding PadR family transcriptional regulator